MSYYSRPQVTSYNTYYHSTPHLPPYSAYDFQVGTLRDVSLFSGKVKPSGSAGLLSSHHSHGLIFLFLQRITNLSYEALVLGSGFLKAVFEEKATGAALSVARW